MSPRAMASALIRACNFRAGSKGLLAPPVRDDLDGLEQAAPADVADMVVVAEGLAETAGEMRPLRPHIGEKVVALDHRLHGKAAAQASGWPR